MRSLQARLSLGLLVGLVIVFVVQWYVAHRALEYFLIRYASIHLEEDAETLLSALKLDNPADFLPDNSRVDSRYQRPFSGRYFVLTVGTTTTQSRSLWDFPLRIPHVETGETVSTVVSGPAAQQLLLVVRGFRKADSNVVIAVAEDIRALRADVQRFQWQFAALATALLVILIALHMAWVRRGLAPLKTIQHELEALETGSLKELTVELAPSEVQPLVRRVNQLLGVILSRMERSRRALGNLAHALKTPLTALMQQIDRPELDQNPQVQTELRRYSETVRDLIERELKRARVAGTALPSQRYDLATEVESLLQTVRMVHRDKSLSIDSEVTATPGCPLDREDLMELLGNLLDNACKWARLRVQLTIAGGNRWIFTVEDDGPGVAQEDVGRIAQRGVRVDETTSGHGLGLSIVQDLVENYQGTVTFDASAQLGGLRVVVSIPRSGM